MEAFAIQCTVKLSWMEKKKSPFFQFPENFTFIKGSKDLLDSENFVLLSLLLHEI